MIPDKYGDDRAFLFATEIEHHPAAERWHIRVDPDDRLVGPAVDLDVETLQASKPRWIDTDTGYAYRGRILFSAGVVLVVNGQIVLLKRDSAAPSDPGQWQSPAGRCEEQPGVTGFRELYEEIAIAEGDRPVFIEPTADDCSASFEGVYKETLRRCGFETSPDELVRYPGTVPAAARNQTATVITEYDSERYTCDMLAFFDEERSTLECRHPVAIEVDDPTALEFTDGEFDRVVRRFPPEDVISMAADGDLVPTDTHLAQTLYPRFG